MALSNRERIGRGLQLLAEGLQDVVDPVMTNAFGTEDWHEAWAAEDASRHGSAARRMRKHDVQTQLRAITEKGREFNSVLTRSQQSYASELREVRNKWAHEEPGEEQTFSSDDTLRALDTMERLLLAVDAVDSAADIKTIRLDLQRTVYEKQARDRAKRIADVNLPAGVGMKPWREIVRPHDDVARGQFTAAEFAADLHDVATAQSTSSEYADPIEFFSRTYLTEGLRDLLTRALKRLAGDTNTSPVINLQTNFGGGKTHSMLALYHLFGGTPTAKFPQEVQELIGAAGDVDPAELRARRVALVGTAMQPGAPSLKEDGTEVFTLWGELAWQLGGRDAYNMVADADRNATNPGDALRTLLREYSPALILVVEWVAYARQLITERELPAGSFDTQFTFAQSLTEAVAAVPGTMLVVSIPASDRGDASTDNEIGGEHGRLALERLQNVIRRVADQWRPSNKDESFEIVRRRIFQEPDAEGRMAIAAIARAFANMYRQNKTLFPREASNPNDDYEVRIRASYPLHPELLDRLYEDWSTLERFQRTRGVLKLVSSIVHELWDSEDAAPIILPGNVPLHTTSVNTDLTQYLEDRWKPIIDADIDGAGATAVEVDKERSVLGQRFTTRRIARTVFMGSAPRAHSERKGIDKSYVWLGTAMPGDTLENFKVAVEQLAQRSTYFYEEQGHYWFDTQPSVTKTASDFAERLREDEETVWGEIVARLRQEERSRGVFGRVHIAPGSSADIPDAEETRLVVVHPRYTWNRRIEESSPNYQWVYSAVESKGTSQRSYRNTLVFLLADAGELGTLEAGVRMYLGWRHVLEESESLNLSVQQRKQSEEQTRKWERTVQDRLHSTYIWAVYPEQLDPKERFTLADDRIGDSGDTSFAEHLSSRMQRQEQVVTNLAPAMLGHTIQRQLGDLWRQRGELTVGELWRYLTSYVYLPRLVSRRVLDAAVEAAGTSVLVPEERFAVADGKNEDTGRYRGLVIPGQQASGLVHVTDHTLLVDWDRAVAQATADREAAQGAAVSNLPDGGPEDGYGQVVSAELSGDAFNQPTAAVSRGGETAPSSVVEERLARYFGSVTINSDRYARDLRNISSEIIERLASTGAKVQITIDIQAVKPEGFNDADQRVIKENAATLKFRTSDFERE